MQWPGSYCKYRTVDGCCKPTTSYDLDVDFLVKGLYTYSASGQPVKKRNTTKFFVNAVSSLSLSLQSKLKAFYFSCFQSPITDVIKHVKQLSSLIGYSYVHWPSIEWPSNNGVFQWRDAWTNYGVRSGLSEKDNFQKAIQLRTKVNILSALKGEGKFFFFFFSYLQIIHLDNKWQAQEIFL